MDKHFPYWMFWQTAEILFPFTTASLHVLRQKNRVNSGWSAPPGRGHHYSVFLAFVVRWSPTTLETAFWPFPHWDTSIVSHTSLFLMINLGNLWKWILWSNGSGVIFLVTTMTHVYPLTHTCSTLRSFNVTHTVQDNVQVSLSWSKFWVILYIFPLVAFGFGPWLMLQDCLLHNKANKDIKSSVFHHHDQSAQSVFGFLLLFFW